MRHFLSRSISILTVFVLAGLLVGCYEAPTSGMVAKATVEKPPFGPGQPYATVRSDRLEEVSGLACSRTFPGHFWAHNDSGDGPDLHRIDDKGARVMTYSLDEGKNRDWEDMAVAPDPQKPDRYYLYLADAGDNDRKYDRHTIYRVVEPRPDDGETLNKSKGEYAAITFRYPDGQRFDSETLLADPLTGDLIVFTKRLDRERAYLLPYPHDTRNVITAKLLGDVDITWMTAGCVSQDGTQILLKDYKHVYHWRRSPQESVWQALQRTPSMLPYQSEPQGEAIAFAPDGQAYFTLSEKARGGEPILYIYRKNP